MHSVRSSSVSPHGYLVVTTFPIPVGLLFPLLNYDCSLRDTPVGRCVVDIVCQR